MLRAFEGNSRLVRVPWEEIKGVPVTKLAVQYGMVQSRGEPSRPVEGQADLQLMLLVRYDLRAFS